eukprot:scaffold681953_cov57-Prasinocladus_malaysianus.AAC.1
MFECACYFIIYDTASLERALPPPHMYTLAGQRVPPPGARRPHCVGLPKVPLRLLLGWHSQGLSVLLRQGENDSPPPSAIPSPVYQQLKFMIMRRHAPLIMLGIHIGCPLPTFANSAQLMWAQRGLLLCSETQHKKHAVYVEQVMDPDFDPWKTPHSCGDLCGRDLDSGERRIATAAAPRDCGT